jgi:metal-responsive CopG/Arc/MetJ family transcriptional regulator
MNEYNIMAVLINHRSKKAPTVQEVFTKHGCSIRMRLGLHEAGDVCSEEGMVLLQLVGEKSDIKALEDELNGIEGVKAKTLSISAD